MSTFIRNAAQRRWAAALLTQGFQAGVEAAYDCTPPFGRAYRWIGFLEDHGVIQQWVIDYEHGFIDVTSPSGAPLYLAGENWGAFLDEARRAHVVPPDQPAP